MRRTFIPALLLFAATSAACTRTALEPEEGHVEVPGGRIWYRVVGGGTKTPLVLLHGGPGAPSHYLNPLAALADERPVIFYDQLGAGRADRPTDTSLWRIERFVDELRLLREALQLEEVHILGHSWGTMLAVDYLRTNPAGVQSLVLASPALSVKRWCDDATRLKATLPADMQAAIAAHESTGTYDAPEYQAAVAEYYKRYLCRRDPWPDDVQRTFAELGMSVYGTMWGPSEFTATGPLKTYERAEDLKDLDVPVLLTAGQYDEVTPETMEYYRSRIPDARLVILANGAHLTMQDEPEAYVQAVRDFLRDVEAR